MFRKILAFAFVPLFALALTACTKQISSQSLYGFPEPTTEISITHYGAGAVATYSLTENTDMLPVMQWYYGLKLKEVRQRPEMAEGNESFEFVIDGTEAFTYDSRGSEAYLYVNDLIYEVKNPSNPPLDF